jgi:hypothetical protein
MQEKNHLPMDNKGESGWVAWRSGADFVLHPLIHTSRSKILPQDVVAEPLEGKCGLKDVMVCELAIKASCRHVQVALSPFIFTTFCGYTLHCY